MERIRFGPAGNSDSFAAMGYKSNKDIVDYVVKMGLNAYEYQCGRGVRLADDTASVLKEQAEAQDVVLTLHAPYYISLSSVEEEKRNNSVEYILQSARAVRKLGGRRIVIHSGSTAKMTRETATELAAATLRKAQQALDEEGLDDIIMCPETMGKIGQLGTLDEVLTLCGVDERMLPCIDFGHLNSRTQGGVQTTEDFLGILEAVENALGVDRMRRFHAHFSKIEYTAGGEKQHLTFADTQFGPDFEPLAEVLVRKNACPIIICESDGTQAEDALAMRRMFESAAGRAQ